jgi:hypothetical protein
VGFVVDKVALGQVFSEYFGFPANPHSTNCSITIIIIIRGWYNRPTVATVPSGLSLTPPRETKKNSSRDETLRSMEGKTRRHKNKK